MPSFLRPVRQAFVSMVVSYALSRHVTPLFPLSGFALRDHSQKMALSPTQRLEIEKREKTIVSRALSFFPLSSLPPTQKGLRLRRREIMAYYEKRTPIALAFFHASKVDQRPFLWRAAGYFGLGTCEKLLALRASGDSFNFHDFECLVLYAAVYPGVYCLGAQRFTPSVGELHDVTIERF